MVEGTLKEFSEKKHLDSPARKTAGIEATLSNM